MTNPTNILSLVLNGERVTLAGDMISDLGAANVYLGIGHNQQWPSGDALVAQPTETTDAINAVYRNLCAMKLLQVADAVAVIRRVDWTANTFYDEYDENVQMFSYVDVDSGNGTVSVANSVTVVGTNTTFTKDFAVNELIQLPGDGINILPETREVIAIASDTSLTVNLAFTGNIISNTPYSVSNSYPNYALNFYARNSYDQVFICLFNNFGIASTVMPALSIGGDLPSDPYILTSDGYFWKYLYTIPSGSKQQFFSAQWMPVYTESQVSEFATDGALTVFKIVNGGTGYNSNTASFSAPILTIVGDGTGANVTAQVSANGTITGLNIISPGSGYTVASVVITPGATGNNGNIVASIPPASGGWGANAALELGATWVMFSVTLDGTENGSIPTVDDFGTQFSYRQLSLIQNPTLTSNAAILANALNYDLTSTVSVASNTPFGMNDIVYQSANGNYAGQTFSATVVWFDNTVNLVHINNISGTFQPQTPLYGTHSVNTAPYTTVTAFTLTPPLVQQFSGQCLYYENRSAVYREPAQTEDVRLIIGF